MGKRVQYTILFFICFQFLGFSQDYSVSSFDIPVELRDNANAVIRDHAWEITVADVDRLETKRRYVVTILNKVGFERFASTVAFYDNDSKIKSISAKFYDASGKQIKKYNKSKFTDVSAVSGGTLYDDSRVLYVEYTPISYPFTLVFEVESSSRTTGFIPTWKPQRSYYLAIEKSSYKLINETNSEIRTKEKYFDGFDIEKKELDNGFEYTIKNVKPIKYESYSIGIRDLTPEVRVASNNFALKGVLGSATNWEEFGKWMYEKLLKGRSELEQSTKDKILELTQGVEDPIEKAKIVYKFVQDKTRYISVQVGIGGWEPIAANQVDKVGYGDCKGLTNYTKALLDVVGVKSYYTVVYADDQVDMDQDFASIEGNHIILNLPNGEEDIWLECTSQTIPFGFLGAFTDDRNVLVVKPEGGVIKRTTAYLNEDNLQTVNADIVLDPTGNVKAKVDIKSRGIQYDDRYFLDARSSTELRKYYKSNFWSYNDNLEIEAVNINNNKGAMSMTETLDVSIPEYAAINGNDYLIKVNMFNRYSAVPKRYRNRKLPLKIRRGFKDVDVYTFTIPDGYRVELLPPDKNIENKFGSYKVIFKQIDDKTFQYNKSFLIKAGEHPKEDYSAYRKFIKSVAKYENLRISLTKKS